jgi:hypothetical protein
MKFIKHTIVSLALLIGVGVFTLAPAPVGAVNLIADTCKVDPNATICNSKGEKADTLAKNIVNTLLLLLGIAAVIVIIIAGIMYAISAGEAAQITKAKNAILYAVVGLVVAFSAYAIVNWVLHVFG